MNFLLFGLLFARLSTGTPITGSTLPLYLCGYAAYRIGGDCLRAYSARPDWGPLSEAQWVAALVLVGTATTLALGIPGSPPVV